MSQFTNRHEMAEFLTGIVDEFALSDDLTADEDNAAIREIVRIREIRDYLNSPTAWGLEQLSRHGLRVEKWGNKGYALFDNEDASLQIGEFGGVAPTKRAAVDEGLRRIASGHYDEMRKTK